MYPVYLLCTDLRPSQDHRILHMQMVWINLAPAHADFWLRTASGALMPGMGFLMCNMHIGDVDYKQQFIVCRQLTPGIILDRDFLAKIQLGITWGPEGVLQLRDSKDIPIQTMEEVTTFPAVMTTKVVIPPRSVILVLALMTLPLCDTKKRFDFIPEQMNHRLHPNCIIYPLDYATIRGGQQRGLQALINLGQQDIELQQGIT